MESLDYKFTEYFEKEVLRKRPYLKKEWCAKIIEKPIRVEPQERNRFRFWGVIPDLEGRILRVITLGDKADDSQCLSEQGVLTMEINYYPETDSLYIDLSEKSSVESKEISEGIVLDYDAEGNLVGIDIDNASVKVQLEKLSFRKLPADIRAIA